MERIFKNKWVMLGLFGLGLWLGVKYLLPLLLPFVIGSLLALAAEPVVRLASRKMKRPLATGVGIGATLVLLGCVVVLVGAFAVKELAVLVDELPDMQASVQGGIRKLNHWLDEAVERSPEGIRGILQQTVDRTFSKESALVMPVAEQIPTTIANFLLWIPTGAVTIFTTLVSAFMISARLPVLRQKLHSWLPASWEATYLPAVRQIRRGIWGWLKAQTKLMLITGGVLTAGFLLLRVEYAVFRAALIALVDAVPVLGTGTVLIPWALFSFLRGNTPLGIGLLGIYGVALTVRTVLEPRLVGRHLGLDPLLTLIAFYVGFTLWGFLGMLLAPVLAVAIGTVTKQKQI